LLFVRKKEEHTLLLPTKRGKREGSYERKKGKISISFFKKEGGKREEICVITFERRKVEKN